MKRALFLIFSILIASTSYGQMKLKNNSIFIDFDNSEPDSNNGTFDASCLDPSPATGGLDSDSWRVFGNGYGVVNDCSSLGGPIAWPFGIDGENIYAVNRGGNIALGLSPKRTGGNLIVNFRVQNNSIFTLTEWVYTVTYGYYNTSDNSEVIHYRVNGSDILNIPSPGTADNSSFEETINGAGTFNPPLAPGDILEFEIEVVYQSGSDCAQCGDDWFIDQIGIGANYPPVINKVFPQTALQGSTITLYGDNFNFTPSDNTVTFTTSGGSAVGTVLGGSSNVLKVTVPGGLSGPAAIDVEAVVFPNNLSSSSPINFVIEAPPENNFEFQENSIKTGESFELATAFDADNDGDIDVFTGHTAGNQIKLWLNDGTGSFSPYNGGTGELSVGDISPISMTHADINADGWEDLIVSGANNISLYEVVIFQNDAMLPVNLSPMLIYNPNIRVDDIEPIDADLDGDLDLIVVSTETNEIGWLRNDLGNYTFGASISSSFTNPQFINVNDIDGDDVLDIVVGIQSGTKWFKGDGAGGFTLQLASVGESLHPYSLSIVTADLDNDTDLDWIYGTSDYVQLWESTIPGSNWANFGSLNPQFDGDGLTSPAKVQIADIDGDGNNDVIAVGNYGAGVDPTTGGGYWWSNNGAASFGTATQFLTKPGYSLEVADFDGDGDLDLLTALGTNGVSWHRNVFVPVLSASPIDITSCVTSDGIVSATVDESPNGGSATEVNGYTFNFYDGADTDSPLGQSMSSSFYANLAVGTYTVQAVRTSTGAITNSITVSIADISGPPTVTPTIIPLTACNADNGEITIDASYNSDTTPGFFTFDWYLGNGIATPFNDGFDGNIVGTNGETINALQPGTYTVVVTHNGSGCASDPTVLVVPDNTGTPTVNLTEDSPQYQCSPPDGGVTAAASYNSDTDPSLFTFQWYVGNGTSIPFVNAIDGDIIGTNGESIANVLSGEYTVVATHNALGCMSGATTISVTNETLCIVSEQAAGFEDIDIGRAMWVDFTGDGLVDVAVTGRDSNGLQFTELYQNNAGSFAAISNSISDMIAADMDWADYDNDGDMDLAIMGLENLSLFGVVHVWRNDGASLFTEVTPGVMTGLYNGSISWVDYDNDGDEDILMMGERSDGPNTAQVHLYNYDIATDMFTEVATNLPAVSFTDLDWADYDGDGDLDLLLTGLDYDYATARTGIFRNDGNGIFTDLGIATNYFQGSVAWGDLDSDGDMDAFTTGDDAGFVSTIYLNNGGDSFTAFDPGMSGLVDGDIALGDFDNDGDLDVLGTGNDGVDIITMIYTNESGTFVGRDNGFTGVELSSVNVLDYDLDGDLDFLIAGVDDLGFNNTLIFDNDVSSPNSAPSIPSGLSSSITGGRVTLNWAATSDDLTAFPTYNIRIGSSPGIEDILSPESDLPTGLLLKSKQGNVGLNTSFGINLPPGTYYWSVQAIDAALKTSAFSTEQTFTVLEEVDFSFTEQVAGNSFYYAGESTGVFATLQNNGNIASDNKGSGGESTIPVQVYISDTPDNTGSIFDQVFSGTTSGSLSPGGKESLNMSVNISSTYTAGTYYFIFVADPADIFAEANESNNAASVPIEIIDTEVVPQPNFTWTASQGSPGTDLAFGVAVDDSGNVITVGRIDPGATFQMDGEGSTSLGSNSTTQDMFITKYSSAGTMLWTKTIGNNIVPGNEIATGVGVDDTGAIYVTGTYWGTTTLAGQSATGIGGNDVFLLKLDPNGNTQWLNTFGSTGNDIGRGIDVDNGNNIYVTGNFEGPITIGSTTLNGDASTNVFVAKYDSQGTVLWANETGLGNNSFVNKISVDEISGISYICGFITGTHSFGPDNLTTSGGLDAFVAKLNFDGTVAWGRSGGGAGSDIAHGLDFFEGINGTGLYVTGYFEGTATFGSQVLSTVTRDMFLLKLDTDGADLGSRQYESDASSFSFGEDVVVDDFNGERIYITGRVFGNVSTQNSNLNSPAGNDIYVSIMDFSFNEISVAQFGGTGFDVPRDLARSKSVTASADLSRYYLAAQYSGSLDIQGTIHPGSGDTDALLMVGTGSIADTDPPTFVSTNIAASTDTQAGGNPTVEVQDTGSGVDIVTVTYSGISGKNADGQATLTNTSGDTYEWDVSGLIDYDPIGIDYIVRAVDLAGNANQIGGTIHRGYSDANDLTIPFSNFGSTSDDYRMISIPINLYNNSIKNALEDDLGTYDPSKWRIFNYTGTNFAEQNNGTFQVGKSYFLIVKQSSLVTGDGGVIDTGSGVVDQNITSSEPFRLALRSGWNQIASPYPFNVSWSDVLIANSISSEVDPELWEFTGTAGYRNSSTLDAFKGYFVNANQNITLNIPVAYQASLNGRVTDEISDERWKEPGAWKLDLVLSSGNRSSSVAGIGMHPDANSNKDQLDVNAIPRFIDWLDIQFSKDETLTLTRDIVPISNNQEWSFTASNSKPDQSTTLYWDHTKIPDYFEQIVLFDKVANKRLPMREFEEYTYEGSEREFEILAGSEEFIQENLIPEKISVNVFPNPSEGLFFFDLGIPGTGSEFVDIIIYDNTGKVVVSKRMNLDKGFHLVEIDAGKASNQPLKPGMYIYKLKANNVPGYSTGKIIIR